MVIQRLQSCGTADLGLYERKRQPVGRAMAKSATATADAISFVVFLLTIVSVALYMLKEAGIFKLIDRFP